MPTKQKARKEYICGRSGRTIHKGEMYWRHSFRFVGTMIRAEEHPFTPSELTTSEYLSTVRNLQENTDSLEVGFYTKPEDLEVIIDSLIEELETTIQEQESKLDNIPDNLCQSPVAELLSERIDVCQNAINELTYIDLDDVDVEAIIEELDYPTEEEIKEAIEEQRQERIEEILNEIIDAICELEV